MKEKITIFGASTAGKACYEIFKDKYEVIYFCDNNEKIVGQFIDNIEIISPNKLKNLNNQYDKIIVASSYYREIIGQLLEMKIDKPIQSMKIQLEENQIQLDFRKDYNKLINFINGDMLAFGMKIEYNNLSVYKDRNTVIKNVVAGNSVIDLGCADHINAINSKIVNDKWLHSIVKKVANKCIGIDNNKEAVDYLHELGYENVVYADIIEDDIEQINNKCWDYLLMADILEHINNPVDFLKKIKNKYKENIKSYLITVPNAFSRYNLESAKNNVERINTDHRYWFTPYTITKVLHEANFEIEKLIMCGYKKRIYFTDESLMMPMIAVIAK